MVQLEDWQGMISTGVQSEKVLLPTCADVSKGVHSHTCLPMPTLSGKTQATSNMVPLGKVAV